MLYSKVQKHDVVMETKQNLWFIPPPIHSSDNLNLKFLLLTSNVVGVTVQMTADSSESISQHGFV